MLRILIRHFFDRFFDTESLSPQGEPTANLTQTLGILAVPAGFFVLLFRPLSLYGWSLVAVRYFFLSISMIAMGFIMVFEWEALFPDRRDYQILTPLPIRLSTMFLAKAAALGIFLGIFLLDINFFGALFWPGIDSGPNLVNLLTAHVATVFAAGLFAALAIASLQGVLITVLPGTVYRRVSVIVQTATMGMLVMLLFLAPMMGGRIEGLVKQHSSLVYWWPGFWFAGLYEQLRPATRNPTLAHTGTLAIRALWCAAAVFLVTYIPLYRRHARKMLEAPELNPSGPGRFRGWIVHTADRRLLPNPVENAVFHFMGQTITRSVKHRLFLATYGGFGAAVAVMSLGSGDLGLLRLPLTLSFVLVSGLRAAFNFPSELRANWAFQVSETSESHPYLHATRKWIVVCAILPLFALLAPMEFACFPWPAALFHLAFGIALSVLLMEVMFLGFRKVPFTCSHFPGKVNLVALGVIYIMGFTMYSRTLARFEAWLALTPAAAALFFVSAALACLLLSRWEFRNPGEAAVLDYEDRGDPVVRTLDLTPQ